MCIRDSGTFEQQQFGTAGVEDVKVFVSSQDCQSECDRLMTLMSSKPQSPPTPLCVLCVNDGTLHQLSTVIEGVKWLCVCVITGLSVRV